MHSTANKPGADRITVTMQEFQNMMGCGYPTALRIAAEAGARIKIGKRLLINVEKVRAYLTGLSE